MGECVIPAMTREQLLKYFDGVIGNLQAELTSLRSRTSWHYSPEVPEDGSDVLFISGDRKLGGRYVDKFSGFTTPGVSHANVVAWCYWPIAWTALPREQI